VDAREEPGSGCPFSSAAVSKRGRGDPLKKRLRSSSKKRTTKEGSWSRRKKRPYTVTIVVREKKRNTTSGSQKKNGENDLARDVEVHNRTKRGSIVGRRRHQGCDQKLSYTIVKGLRENYEEHSNTFRL